MYKHTHAGVCAGFSAAVDTGERRGSTGGIEKRWRWRGVSERDRQSEGNGDWGDGWREIEGKGTHWEPERHTERE